MKIFKILFIVLVLFISVSAVYADGNFTSLQTEINNAGDSIEITQDYIYDNSTDFGLKNGILVNKTNFTINGNGHTVDGAGQARIFSIQGNVTLLNIKIINGFNNQMGGAIFAGFSTYVNCENVTFVNNRADSAGAINGYDINLINCEFTKNQAKAGAGVYGYGNITVKDTKFLNSDNYSFSQLYGYGDGKLQVNNCLFLNLTSRYAPAIYSQKRTSIKNSNFTNLAADMSCGAVALKGCAEGEFENCLFVNTTALKNAGALFIDIGANDVYGNVSVKNSKFINCNGDFGGAIVQLGGNLSIVGSDFIDNSVIYDGEAIYVSYTNFELINSKIMSNTLLDEDFDGGGLYCDYSNVTITNSTFENNVKNAIYSYDSNLSVENTTFNENNRAIHGIFTSCKLINNEYGNDTLFLNDTNYPFVIEESGAKIELINNDINVTDLPVRFDSRDWGWVSSVKDQGAMGACWTFGACGALESALLKATGIEYNFSEKNVQDNILRYAKYGMKSIDEGSSSHMEAVEYMVSWFGALPNEYDIYDELAKLSPIISTEKNFHVQDIMFVGRKNATDNDAIKRAIMKCGSLTFEYYLAIDEPYYNEKTHSSYQNFTKNGTHSVSVVGWDDNFSKENFLITPPGDGAFILKNSHGVESDDKGFLYISYYDTSILTQNPLTGYLIENIENYTKIYQRDISGDFDEDTNHTTYKINYVSTGNDLISGIGSYFNESEEYVLEIYVNDELKHTENGIAPFYGYHTVKLTSEIPVKEKDNFTVIMKKDFVPILDNSRMHNEKNTVFIQRNGTWADLALESKTATLKVYTKDLAIYTEDLVKIYKNDSKFEANVGAANESVIFEINGANYTRVSNENGTARITINLNPGNYTIKTTFNGTSVDNSIEVLPTLIAQNLVKYFRNESQFYISLIDGAGNFVPNATITMNINGVFYNRTTNENGTSRLNINLNPGEYILTALDPLTGLMMSYNITVLSVLTADDINMTYNDGTQFTAKLVDGQGNPLENAGVTFNINGVFYTRYTNSSGIACLNINLMSGEYIITSQYENAVISNKITISAKKD
ncbi:C1 family peptidase [Methanobrevibacter sp.]|uniref:C1 family peptidase n=1 Tax=Methanobrevibacter sp. TaxID=66852 RepID=UPI00388F0C41